MNPWGEAAPQPRAERDPVSETFAAIQLFEKERKDSNIASYRRNDAYWIELKKMHAECLIDLSEFVEYLTNKKDSNRKQGMALSVSTRQGLNSSKSVVCKAVKDDDAMKSGKSHGAGMQTRKALEEFDSSMSSKLLEESEFIEKDLLKTFTSQVENIEEELKALWLRGDRLLFAVKLSDLRAKKNFDTYANLVAVQTKQAASASQPISTSQKIDSGECNVGQDLWLAEVYYSVAAARSYEVKDECNKQLRFVFARAKDIETRRRAMISKAGETLLTRQLEMWRNFPALAGMVGERVVRIQSDPSDPLCNIGKTLASRVEIAHDSVALAMMTQQQDRLTQQREYERERFRSVSGSGAGDSGREGREGTGGMGYAIPIGVDGTPRLPFPLRSPSLTESSIFQRQNVVSMMTKTWSPVLLCLSSAGYLHIFDMDPKGELGTDASAFSNVAEKSRKGVELEIFSVPDSPKVVPDPAVKAVPFDPQSLNFILQTENFMVPSASLTVALCRVQFTPTANDTVFEVIEETPITGIGSLFISKTERR